MTDRGLRRAVIAVSSANAALLVGANVFVVLWAGASVFVLWEIFIRMLLLPFLAIGLVIGLRHSRNKVGWLFIGGTSAILVNELSFTYANYALQGGSAGGVVAAWLTSWVWVPAFAAIGAVFLVFPTGVVSSPRWRFVGWSLGIGVTLNVLGNALVQRPIDGFEPLANPFGIGGPGGAVFEFARGLGGAMVGISILLSGLSLVLRFKGSTGEERQQLKWFVFAAAIVTLSVFGLGATYREGADPSAIVVFFEVMAFLSVLFMAAAIGLAILRYRLYDIDVIINRALVYGGLTAVLAAAYVGLVFGFQAMLSPFTAESDLAVAASTLGVAALFRPVRARLQSFIDRRFYRRKFDAHRTIEEFNSRLRDQVDLSAMSTQLLSVVNETMQPAHVSVWLRPEARA